MASTGKLLEGLIFWAFVGYLAYRLIKFYSRHEEDAQLKRYPSAGLLPYQKKWYLLSRAERDFYETICQVASDSFLIFQR